MIGCDDITDVINSVVIADNIPNLESAVQFALNLHRASNVPHKLFVHRGDIIELVLILDNVQSSNK